jgi:hypothetical protein
VGLSGIFKAVDENIENPWGQSRMMSDRTAHYPYDLAQLVAERLQAEQVGSPPENVLVRLFEILYFASFLTDEGRPILCTVNYVDPADVATSSASPANQWSYIPFERPLPLDVRTLTKLARAADPHVSSLAVSADASGDLYIWGMFDQEPRHGDYITLDSDPTLERPGLFQATITGTGNVSVHQNSSLLGTLSRDVLVESYYDVLWMGPVHGLLVTPVRQYLVDHCHELVEDGEPFDPRQFERELLLRWINSIARILVNIQHYRHGGGMIIAPHISLENLLVKYRITYDRLLHSLWRLVHVQFRRGRAMDMVRDQVEEEDSLDGLRMSLPLLRDMHIELEHRKNEILGTNRFIAALSCVDGVVLLDNLMRVHGFGVELRTDNSLNEIYLANDAQAMPERLREVELAQFGTRHRAMMRYCYQYPGTLGFAISQDGDIQAMTRIGSRLVYWENIDVQLAFKAENWIVAQSDLRSVLKRLNLRLEA